jgi:hypothetical protein
MIAFAMTDLLVAPRATLDLETPWVAPGACTPVRLRRASDGTTPRLATSVAVWFDDTFLSVLFSGTDDHILATHLQHDAPLYEEDVVEVFLAPERLTQYFELEVNPLGTLFDAQIDSPDGHRRTMDAHRDWTCAGAYAALIRVQETTGELTFDTLLRIPFAGLGRTTPADGEVWRANFFRIDRHPRLGDEFSAWQPTLRTPADFHVAAAFGSLRFSA